MNRKKVVRTPVRITSSGLSGSITGDRTSNSATQDHQQRISSKQQMPSLDSLSRAGDETQLYVSHDGLTLTPLINNSNPTFKQDKSSASVYVTSANTFPVSGIETPPLVKQAMKGTGIGADASRSQAALGGRGSQPTSGLPTNHLINANARLKDLKVAESNCKDDDKHPLDSSMMYDDDDEEQRQDENGVHSWTDAHLADRYNFEKEIGYGNWGSCWLVCARTTTASVQRGSSYAVKLVHRQGTPPSNARVKALWNEYKVLRACGKPTHPNLVHFKEFVITPSYALVVMDFYRQAMNVALPETLYAGSGGYFCQLLSSISWLHERFVTHCDIKVANLLVDTAQDKVHGRPILVDFGFATLHDTKTNFVTSQTWGTPEYLSPERSRGDRHDERLSDIWALGVTFFEIATGRTPFEHEEEQFLTKEQLDVYYNRTLEPEWVGKWSIPHDLEKLCKEMLSPNPSRRIYAREALQHEFFRADTSFDLEANSRFNQRQGSVGSVPPGKGRDFKKDEKAEEKDSKKSYEQMRTSNEQNVKRFAFQANDSEVRLPSLQIGEDSMLSLAHTPPVASRKDDRREQIRIVVDESEGEAEMSAELTTSSYPNNRRSNKDDSSKRPGSNESSSARKAVDFDSRNMRKSPYPPSTSKRKMNSLRPATSSSERRHSPQTNDFSAQNRPATVHGREVDMPTDEVEDVHGDGWSSLETSLDRKGRDSEVQQAALVSPATLSRPGIRSPPSKQKYEVHLEGALRYASPSNNAHELCSAQHSSLVASAARSMNQLASNIVDPALHSDTEAENLERKLDQMDRLAATLVDMVRETRVALHRAHGSRHQGAVSNGSEGRKSTQHHHQYRPVTAPTHKSRFSDRAMSQANRYCTATTSPMRPSTASYFSSAAVQTGSPIVETRISQQLTTKGVFTNTDKPDQKMNWQSLQDNGRNAVNARNVAVSVKMSGQACLNECASDLHTQNDYAHLREQGSGIRSERDSPTLDQATAKWSAIGHAKQHANLSNASLQTNNLGGSGANSSMSLLYARSSKKTDENLFDFGGGMRASPGPMRALRSPAQDVTIDTNVVISNKSARASPVRDLPGSSHHAASKNSTTMGKGKLSLAKAFTLNRSNSVNVLAGRRRSKIDSLATPTASLTDQRRNTLLDLNSLGDHTFNGTADRLSHIQREHSRTASQPRASVVSCSRSLPSTDHSWTQPRADPSNDFCQYTMQTSPLFGASKLQSTTTSTAKSTSSISIHRPASSMSGIMTLSESIGNDPPRATPTFGQKTIITGRTGDRSNGLVNRHQQQHAQMQQHNLPASAPAEGRVKTSGALWRMLTNRMAGAARGHRNAFERAH